MLAQRENLSRNRSNVRGPGGEGRGRVNTSSSKHAVFEMASLANEMDSSASAGGRWGDEGGEGVGGLLQRDGHKAEYSDGDWGSGACERRSAVAAPGFPKVPPAPAENDVRGGAAEWIG